jgi:ubiquinone/menaquinone biosynthesis C-methylase UbiE
MPDVHDRIRDFWDADAETYDRSAIHAASNPVEAAAWRAILRRHLPAPSGDEGPHVLDVGAGTGAMTLLLAELGYRVTALDLSEAMLGKARDKAHRGGFDGIDFVTGRADNPPAGPFDAIVERSMLWTNPNPEVSLEAWRRVTVPGGTLLVMEAIHEGAKAARRARGLAAEAIRKAVGMAPDHHADYDAEVLEQLPLARASTPEPLLAFVEGAGWRRVRIERLRDVEWVRRLAAPNRALAELEAVPLYAVIAEA